MATGPVKDRSADDAATATPNESDGSSTARQPGPTAYTLFTVEDFGAVKIGGLAVDSTHVYWAGNGGELMRRPLDGSGKAERIAIWDGTTLGTELAVDQDYVYWVDTPGWMRAPKAGGSPEAFTVPERARDVAASDQYAYAATMGCAALSRLPHGGKTVETVFPSSAIQRIPGGTYLHVDESSVYCASGRYVFVTRDFAPLEEITRDAKTILGITSISGQPYWLDQAGDGSNTNLFRRNNDGQILLVGTTAFSEPNKPFADPAHKRVLFTTGGAVVAMSIATGAWKMLTLTTYPGNGAAIDSQYFYWGRYTTTEASIERMPLSQE